MKDTPVARPSIRVLVVDDSVVVRSILRGVLENEPGLELAGTASNGKIALVRIPVYKPDLVILDVEMPEMDGIETLKRIRLAHPGLPVVMFSTRTAQGTAATMEALELGASDYITKPDPAGGVFEAKEAVRKELIPRIKSITHKRLALKRFHAAADSARDEKTVGGGENIRLAKSHGGAAVIRAVVIGVSTGGPSVLNQLVPALPADLGVPILIVQHMPAMFTRLLAERLDSRSRLTVVEGTDGKLAEAGSVYIAPGEHHMTVESLQGKPLIRLNRNPPVNYCRPSVNVLFCSAAEVFKDALLSVVLTGMGEDGLVGCHLIRQNGGQVVIQDKESSVVWGMPGAVAEAGLAERILPADKIAGEIVRIVRSPKKDAIRQV